MSIKSKEYNFLVDKFIPKNMNDVIEEDFDNFIDYKNTKPEDLWNYAVTALTASNSIGQRLASTATSASNAAIVSSFSI